MNYEFERESGFINSQPSLAECLTSFPPVADSFQSSSIKSSTLSRPTLIPPPFEQTIPSLNPGSHPRHGRPRHSPDGCSQLPTASLPPEYPWMREKKAAKRNHLPTSTATAISNGPVCFSPKGGGFLHHFLPRSLYYLLLTLSPRAFATKENVNKYSYSL